MRLYAIFCAVVGIAVSSWSQDVSVGLKGGPKFNAELSVGFNYDLLKSPTAVSFDTPKGYFGLNIPLRYNASAILDTLLNEVESDTTVFKDGATIQPTVHAMQNANTSVRVDVPLLGGVATFSNIQNFFFNYGFALGNPAFDVETPAGEDFSFLMRGTVNVPLELTLGWETMTFGYAYRVNKNVIFALNLHRHVFSFDLNGTMNVDILGKYSITPDLGENVDFGGALAIKGSIDYPSSKVRGTAHGHYEAEVWSPTLGAKIWRFALTSRFGVNTYAKGKLQAQYSLPFFLDPETFEPAYDFEDPNTLTDVEFQDKLELNAVDGLQFSTDPEKDKMHWVMPHGHTLSFDIIPDRLNLSYTKLFGEMSLSLDGITKTHVTEGDTVENREVGFKVSVPIDNIVMLSGQWHNAFFNLGVFGFDFSPKGHEHILGTRLGEIGWPKFGESIMIPVLRFGSAFGSDLQLSLEVDVLPLPALKSGINYYF